MNSNVVPRKNVELSALQASNMTMRRLFILIDGNRTLAELAKLCHVDEAECEGLIHRLVSNDSITADGFIAGDSVVPVSDDTAESVVVECSGFQDCLIKELSLYIGPIAQMIISKSGADNSVLPISKMMEIVEKVANEIEKPEDKTAFIETMSERINQKA